MSFDPREGNADDVDGDYLHECFSLHDLGHVRFAVRPHGHGYE